MEPKLKLEKIAELAHEANRIFCEAHGDFSQPLWKDALEWQKNSAVNGIQWVLNGNTPRQQHEDWAKDKNAAGWVYGPVKDADKKTHPCLVDYDQLPEYQKAKDALYIAVVKAMDTNLS